PVSRAEVCPDAGVSDGSLSKHEKNRPLPDQNRSGNGRFLWKTTIYL
ncbi:hypothetical protein SAMN05880580_1291, partial [Priestia flexa]